jgi:hypothetical protein
MKERSFYTKSGLIVTFLEIPNSEGRRLVEENGGFLMEQYSNSQCESYYYLLNDKRIVNIPLGPDAYIYEPYDAFIEHMEESHIAKKLSKERPFRLIRHLPNDKTIEVEKVPKDEIAQFLSTAQPLNGSKSLYLLPDGRVLENNFLEATIYQNLVDYEIWAAHIKQANGFTGKIYEGKLDGISWLNLCGINPYGTDFPAHAKDLASSLPRLINAPENLFNFSWGSLVDIDFYLYKSVISPEFSEQVFLPLIAYIGESYIKQKGGQWEMQYNHACGDWLPDVRQADGELKMLYYPISIILNPEEGKGTYYALRMAFSHIASHPVD